LKRFEGFSVITGFGNNFIFSEFGREFTT